MRITLLWLGLDLVILFGLTGVLIGFLLAYGATLRIMPDTLILVGIFFIGNIAYVLFLRRIWHGNSLHIPSEIVAACRDWFPFAVILFVYETLPLYTGLFRSTPIDAILAEIEMELWGIQPTIWMQQFVHPVLVDLMSIAYALQFPLPIILISCLYMMDRRGHFREVASAIIFCNMVGFILYLSFPAGPPRFYLQEVYDISYLPSFTGFYNWTEQFWDNNNPVITHSSFPSQHVAYTVLVMIYAFRQDHWPCAWRWLGPLFTLLAVSLWISTVYLRHHWTPDIAAGFVLGIMSVIVPRLMMAWLFKPVGSQQLYNGG